MNREITHLKNLVSVAFADGRIDDSELNKLRESARQAGVSNEDLNRWIDNADQLVLSVPKEDEEREKHLIEMITLAASDGHFNQEEYQLCKFIAKKLPYSGLKTALEINLSKAQLHNLVALATADGHLDNREMDILRNVADSVDVSEEELQDMIARREEFVELIPLSEKDRENQLIQMITLAIVDEKFTEDEYALCKTVAFRLGFSEEELQMIINLSFKGKVDFKM